MEEQTIFDANHQVEMDRRQEDLNWEVREDVWSFVNWGFRSKLETNHKKMYIEYLSKSLDKTIVNLITDFLFN